MANLSKELTNIVHKIEEIGFNPKSEEAKAELVRCKSRLKELIELLTIECDKPFVKAA